MADPVSSGNGKTIGLALLAFEGAALSYSAWLPSGLTIRTFADSDQGRIDIQHGLIIGTAFNMVLGGGAAILADTPLPFLAAVLGSIIGILIYTYFVSTAHGLGSMKTGDYA